MLRRSERLTTKRDKEIKIRISIFKSQIEQFEKTFGKKKLVYYENICRLFIEENDYFKYDKFNIRIDEIKYDETMRNMLESAKFNKNQLEEKNVFQLKKIEKIRILQYIDQTIQYIEKYLNKKTKLLEKTVLNEDVIREIMSFL
jgi:hypothetical protein